MLDFFESSAVIEESPLHEAHPFVQLPAHASSGGTDMAAQLGNGTVVAMEESMERHMHKYKHHSHSHALGEVHGMQPNPANG